MQDLQNAFLADAPRRIHHLREDLVRLADSGSVEQPELVRKLFRQLHTLKGSAAAYNLSAVSRIAHQLESFLEIINRENFAESIRVLKEGIGEIETALFHTAKGCSSTNSEQKIENWRTIYEKARLTAEESEQINLPFDLGNKLNAKEVEQLRQALKIYPSLAIITVKLPVQNFADRFVEVRSRLSALGEIAATLPDAEKTTSAEIALQLIFVCSEQNAGNIALNLESTNAEISAFWSRLSEDKKDAFTTQKKVKLSNLWAQASLAGRQTAAKYGKKTAFKIKDNADFEVGEKFAEACEIALLHLARNAAAHGIETPEERRSNGKDETGVVCLKVWLENDSLCLRISDDGRGIDREKVWRRANERKLVAENACFDKEKIEQIIFLPGFSTTDFVTEDAGRGVGLDAVQTAIQAAGGTIEVNSETERGTEFSIRFPIDD